VVYRSDKTYRCRPTAWICGNSGLSLGVGRAFSLGQLTDTGYAGRRVRGGNAIGFASR
jgi:hypothetical protein